MDIRISKGTEVPVHEQVAAQLVFLIGTGALKPGASLPSARELARRLGIHRNTINRAYGDLVLNLLAEKRAGRRLVVRASVPESLAGTKDLDDLVDAAVVGARKRGYSLQQLIERLHERVVAAPPDHLLVLSDEAGMRMLLQNELRQRFKCRVEACRFLVVDRIIGPLRDRLEKRWVAAEATEELGMAPVLPHSR